MQVFDVKPSAASRDCLLVDVLESLAKPSQLTSTCSALQHICSTPIRDVAHLKARQQDLRDLSGNKHIPISAEGERDFMWLVTFEEDPDLRELLQIPYFNSMISSWLNDVWPALGTNNVYGMIVSPIICLMSPIVYLFSPLLILWFRIGIKISIGDFLKLMYHSFMLGTDMAALAAGRTASITTIVLSIAASVFVYFQTLRTCVRHAQNLYTACKKITDKIVGADTFVRTSRKSLLNSEWTIGHTRRWLAIPVPEVCECPRFPSRAIPRYPLWDPRIGKALVWFKKLCRSEMIAFMRHVSIFEAVRCISASLGHTNMVTYDDPGFAARGITHPCVPRCVPNNIVLAPGMPGIVLTGPNASGKSTLLRSVGLANIMAQTLGVAYCDAIAVQPVVRTYTHMRIADNMRSGKSRFQAEMQSIAEMISDTEQGHGCLMVVDGIFSSTAADQGVVCLDNVLRRMAAAKECMFILATHRHVTYEGVRHFKMKSTRDNSGKNQSTYNMTTGCNDVVNALELMNGMI